LKLAEQLEKNGDQYAEAWNFGPAEIDARPVQWLVEKMAKLWGENANWINDDTNHPHEANYLRLDCSKANNKLNWHPKWSLCQTLSKIVEWHKLDCSDNKCRDLCLDQINEYMDRVNS
jgi:CDP-glucose 4,6-dehydratase